MRILATCFAVCILLGSGQAQHPPWYPPTADADPSIRHDVIVAMPTRLSVQRTPHRLTVGFDLTAPESVKVTLGDRMTMGAKYEMRIWEQGEARPAEAGITGMAGPVSSSNLGFLKNGIAVLNRVQGGIPAPGKSYIVEEDVTVFETDIPAQHFWSPVSKKYRVLWEGKLKFISAGE
jgi:hypothetical protein